MNSVKEGQDTQITWITATFEYQQVNVLIYPDLIRPHKAALLKVEIEVFIKNFDWKTISITISRNWNINRTYIISATSKKEKGYMRQSWML